MAALCRAALSKVSRGIRDKLTGGGAAGGVSRGGGSGSASISTLMGLQRELTGLAGSVEGILRASDPQVRKRVRRRELFQINSINLLNLWNPLRPLEG